MHTYMYPFSVGLIVTTSGLYSRGHHHGAEYASEVRSDARLTNVATHDDPETANVCLTCGYYRQVQADLDRDGRVPLSSTAGPQNYCLRARGREGGYRYVPRARYGSASYGDDDSLSQSPRARANRRFPSNGCLSREDGYGGGRWREVLGLHQGDGMRPGWDPL